MAEFRTDTRFGVALPFASSLYLTQNFATAVYTKPDPRRLVNVNVVLSLGGGALTVILSLAEAETLRRHMQASVAYGGGGGGGGAAHLMTAAGGEAVDSASGGTLPPAHAAALRFFDSRVFFTTDEIASLITMFEGAPVTQRRTFFEQVLSRRRRQQALTPGVPVGKVFTMKSVARLNELREKIGRVAEAIAALGKSVEDVCTDFDADGDGWLTAEESEWLGVGGGCVLCFGVSLLVIAQYLKLC